MAARATINVVSATANIGSTTEVSISTAYVAAASTTEYKLVESIAYLDEDSNNRWTYEVLPLGDLVVQIVNKNLSDTTTVIDANSLSFEKLTTDSFAFIENFTRAVSYNRNFTDAFTLDDLSQIDKDFYGNKGNIFGFTDILGLSYSKTETDSYTVSDVLSLVNSFVRSFPEAITISDTDSKDFSKETPDNFSALDEHINSFEKNETETLALSQDISLSQGKNETEVIPLSDAINALFSKNIADGFTLDDAALINKDYFGNKGNILGFSDVLSRAVEYNRDYADSALLDDVPSISTSRTIYDEVRVRDSGYTSNALGTTLFNNNQINYTSPDNNVEDVSLTINSSKPEGLGFSDISTRGNIKAISDDISFGDFKGLQLNKSLFDWVALDDSALINKDYFGSKGNIFGITDIFNRSVNFNRTYSETLSFGDSSHFTTAKTITDSVGLSETFERHLTYVRGLTDDVSTSDISTRELAKSLSNITSITDILSFVHSKNSSDGVAALDSNSLQIEKTLSDGFALDDSTLIDKDYFGNKGNIVGISDYITIDYRSGGLLGHSPLNTTSLN